MYILLSIIITLPTAFIMLQYTSTQFFEAIGISSYTKWFLTNDSKDTVLSNVFFIYLDNVAFVILGVGSLWVFLIRYVNKKQKDSSKLIGASKLEKYLYISAILVIAGVGIYAMDSYKNTEEEILSEAILFEESSQTNDQIQITTTSKIVTKQTTKTLDHKSAFMKLQDKLSLVLYEPNNENIVSLRLNDTIIFIVITSGISGLIVSLFEIYVINKID